MSLTEHRYTEAEYLQLVADGVFTDTQLIGGKVYDNVTPSFEHSSMVHKIRAAMVATYGTEYVISENPIRADGLPEPDITVLSKPYSSLTEHPGPDDIFCVIEVSMSSFGTDVSVKRKSYEEAGIESVYVTGPDGYLACFGAQIPDISRVLASL